jgi:hypothetical protein
LPHAKCKCTMRNKVGHVQQRVVIVLSELPDCIIAIPLRSSCCTSDTFGKGLGPGQTSHPATWTIPGVMVKVAVVHWSACDIGLEKEHQIPGCGCPPTGAMHAQTPLTHLHVISCTIQHLNGKGCTPSA